MVPFTVWAHCPLLPPSLLPNLCRWSPADLASAAGQRSPHHLAKTPWTFPVRHCSSGIALHLFEFASGQFQIKLQTPPLSLRILDGEWFESGCKTRASKYFSFNFWVSLASSHPSMAPSEHNSLLIHLPCPFTQLFACPHCATSGFSSLLAPIPLTVFLAVCWGALRPLASLLHVYSSSRRKGKTTKVESGLGPPPTPFLGRSEQKRRERKAAGAPDC